MTIRTQKLQLYPPKHTRPLLTRRTTTWQRTRTIHHVPPLHAHHTHLDHGTYKRCIPRALARPKRRKLQRRGWIPGNVPVGLQGKRRAALAGFSVVFYVPDTWGRVETGAGVGGRDEALFGGRVGANEGSEVSRGESFGGCMLLSVLKKLFFFRVAGLTEESDEIVSSRVAPW